MAKYIDDVIAKVRELSEVPAGRVCEEVALPDFDEGQKMPYIAVVFGTPSHISQATSIVSQLNDGYRVFFLCHVRALTAQHAREIGERILWGLVGFEPDNSGGITVHGGQGLNYAGTNHKVVQCGYELYCSFITNLKNRI